MKILLYLDPWVDVSDKPEFKYNWLKFFLKNSIKRLPEMSSDIEIETIYSDILHSSDLKDNYDWIGFNSVDQNELKNIFTNFDDYVTSQREDTLSDKFMALNKIIKGKLGSFVPDVILIISGSAKYLKYEFPNSLILLQESGIFGRPPYPTTLYFDCCSSMDESFLINHKNDILSFKLDSDSRFFLEKLRSFFLCNITKLNPYRKIIEGHRTRYKKVVLLSLQRFHAPLFRSQSKFKDQIEYIKYIFDNIDDDIGVVVTEHSKDSILSYKPIYDYFSNSYKNFIYLKEVETYPNSSQFLLEVLDGVITTSSTVGLQAMIHRKPLFVPSDNSYLLTFCDESNLKNIGSFLDNNKYQNKDGALYYLLTHYYILGEYFKDPSWFFSFLRNSIDKFKKGIDFSFYNRIDSEDVLLDNICNNKFMKVFKKQIKEASKSSKRKLFKR